jgi:hypothetical protein
MEYILDVQAFRGPGNKFIPKEISIIEIFDSEVVSYLFEPPYSWNWLPQRCKRTNYWLIYNYHGLPWTSGELSLDSIKETLEDVVKSAKKIHVKGLEKKYWLEEELDTDNVIDLDILGCLSLAQLQQQQNHVLVDCKNHAFNGMCAGENVKMLKN